VQFDGTDDCLLGLPALRIGTLIARLAVSAVPQEGRARAFIDISRDGRFYAQIAPKSGQLRVAAGASNHLLEHTFEAGTFHLLAAIKSDDRLVVAVDGQRIHDASYDAAEVDPPRRTPPQAAPPPDLTEKYAASVEELRQRHEVVEGSLLANPEAIRDAAERAGLRVRPRSADFNAYQTWLDRVDYPRNYPKYVREFPPPLLFAKKTLQHFLSFEALAEQLAQRDCVYMDVASSNSIVPDVLSRVYGLDRIYRQDLRYPEGVHGRLIGSDAAAIPLEDSSIDAMALHCALEHFEDQSDIGLVREAARLLRPGGAACVIPLYLADRYYVMTSRFAWERNGIPAIDPDATVVLREENRLKFSRHLDAAHLQSRLLAPAIELGLEYEVLYYHNHRERRGCPPFALLLRRP